MTDSGNYKDIVNLSDREEANAIVSTQPKASMVAETTRIRKLTTKEYFRLMDFDDEDYEKASAVNSNTQLYKQAGNSIVVAVLYYLIWNIVESGVFGGAINDHR